MDSQGNADGRGALREHFLHCRVLLNAVFGVHHLRFVDGQVVGQAIVQPERPVFDLELEGQVGTFLDGDLELAVVDVAPRAELKRHKVRDMQNVDVSG
jgi:hypothetical protein